MNEIEKIIDLAIECGPLTSGIVNASDELISEIEDFKKREYGYQKMHEVLEKVKDKKRLELYKKLLIVLKNIDFEIIEEDKERSR